MRSILIYTTFAVLIITWFGTIAPWKWIPVLFVANYIAGYTFISNWGQFGPFDLIAMAIYSIPCFIASYELIYARKFMYK